MANKGNIITNNKTKFIWFIIYLSIGALFAEWLYKKQNLDYFTELDIEIITKTPNLDNSMRNVFKQYFYDNKNIKKWKELKKNDYSENEIFQNFEKNIQARYTGENWFYKNKKIHFTIGTKLLIRNPDIPYTNLIVDYARFTVGEMRKDMGNFSLKFLEKEFKQEYLGEQVYVMQVIDQIAKYRINYINRERHYILSFFLVIILYVISVVFVREAKAILNLR